MAKRIDYMTACEIGRSVFGCGVTPVQTHYNFVVVRGVFRLQIVRECVVPNKVYCRLEFFSGMIGQCLGYFYYDTVLETISPLHKED